MATDMHMFIMGVTSSNTAKTASIRSRPVHAPTSPAVIG